MSEPTLSEGEFVLRGLVQGGCTDYMLPVEHISGLGIPDVRRGDTPFGDRDGDVGGRDRYVKRILTFPLVLKAPDSMKAKAARQQYVHELRRPFVRAWARVDDAADVPLIGPHMTGMWAIDEPTFFGRPRPVTLDLSQQWAGFIHATAQFECLDPLPYGDLVTVVPVGSPAGFTVDGDMPTYRFTITITGNGGTPSLLATTDELRTILFDGALAGASVAVLDFYSQTVTVDDVLAYPLATDEWFRLLDGVNSITFAGCAGIQIDYRPAYL